MTDSMPNISTGGFSSGSGSMFSATRKAALVASSVMDILYSPFVFTVGRMRKCYRLSSVMLTTAMRTPAALRGSSFS